MADFAPDSFQILIVEDCPIWRQALEAMYLRSMFGDEYPRRNITVAANAKEAIDQMKKNPQQFNLVSLDINLGSRGSLGLSNDETGVAVTGLDVLDQMQKLQRGAAVVVITGATHDSELPKAFTDEDQQEGIKRAKTTLVLELQLKFKDAFRYFPKDFIDQSETDKKEEFDRKLKTNIIDQAAVFETQLTQATLFSLAKKRQEQLANVEVPSICLMVVLDDVYFKGNELGSLFADTKHRFVRFDFFEECLNSLERVDIWDASWPHPYDHKDNDSLMDARHAFYYVPGKGQTLSEAQRAFDRAIQESKEIVLRFKPHSMHRCAAPKNTTTIVSSGSPKLSDVHFEFLKNIARHKIISIPGGPMVGENEKKTACELRSRLRQAFGLREDEQDPVSSKNPTTGDKYEYYEIDMQVFLCSQDYIKPPPKPKTVKRRKVVVPNVINLVSDVASESITNTLLIPKTETEFSNIVKAGHVIETRPAGGEKITIGSEVILVLSKGARKVPAIPGQC